MQGYKEQAFSPDSSASKNKKGIKHFSAAGCEVDLSDTNILPSKETDSDAQKLLAEIANAKRLEVHSPDGKGLLTGRDYRNWRKKYENENEVKLNKGEEINEELNHVVGENYFTRMLRLKGVFVSGVFNEYSDSPKWKKEYSQIEEMANELAHDFVPPEEKDSLVNKLNYIISAINESETGKNQDEKFALIFNKKLDSAVEEEDYLKKYYLVKEIINLIFSDEKLASSLQDSINDWSAILDDVSLVSYSILPVEKKEIIAEELNKLIKEMYEKL